MRSSLGLDRTQDSVHWSLVLALGHLTFKLQSTMSDALEKWYSGSLFVVAELKQLVMQVSYCSLSAEIYRWVFSLVKLHREPRRDAVPMLKGKQKWLTSLVGHREFAHVRLNLLFDIQIHGHVYIARLYEASIVDNLVVIDSSRWPSPFYDSFDPYPLIPSSYSLFQCGVPDADKEKIFQLYEVIRNRRSGEKPRDLKRKLLSIPRGAKCPGNGASTSKISTGGL